jgi:hypothetical protein
VCGEFPDAAYAVESPTTLLGCDSICTFAAEQRVLLPGDPDGARVATAKAAGVARLAILRSHRAENGRLSA